MLTGVKTRILIKLKVLKEFWTDIAQDTMDKIKIYRQWKHGTQAI